MNCEDVVPGGGSFLGRGKSSCTSSEVGVFLALPANSEATLARESV